MTDAVFDTNTFLQAAATENGPSDACWKFAEERKIREFVTETVLAELEDVLTRPKVRRQLPRLTNQHIGKMLDTFRTYSSLVAEPAVVFQLSRDDDDAKFVDLAVATGASYIVTRDRDLLDLHSDSAFSSQFPNLKILTPVGFLEIVRAT